jgi:hypothetical protein
MLGRPNALDRGDLLDMVERCRGRKELKTGLVEGVKKQLGLK